jgi:phenylacetate-coenzyme A ligase PaaK-like adenylate-forming protein
VTRGEDRCPCGAPNSTLAGVQGRMADRFELPDGRSVHPYTLVSPLLTLAPWLRRYQIVQEQPDRIRVKLVPMPGQTSAADSLASIRQIYAQRLGEGISVEVEVVEEIPAGSSGKFRPYYSLVSSPNARRTDA